MPILPVLTDGNPLLRLTSQPIKKIDRRIRQLAKDMVETMRATNGVGLAAPQVGELVRLIVLECRENDRYPEEPSFPLYTVINPIFKTVGTAKCEGEEGCLSVPDYWGLVSRYEKGRIHGLNLQGKPITFNVSGFLARVFQHEIDHLNGVLFTDYIDDPTKLWHKEKT
jgi:peptide deformylase